MRGWGRSREEKRVQNQNQSQNQNLALALALVQGQGQGHCRLGVCPGLLSEWPYCTPATHASQETMAGGRLRVCVCRWGWCWRSAMCEWQVRAAGV